jgi:pyruvate,water dikinase
MVQAGFRVPKGFVVLTSAFDIFIGESGLQSKINSLLEGIRDHNSLSLNSERIQELIRSSSMQNSLREAIQWAFDELGMSYVAVRSSAIAEDSTAASWAGQLESYLNTTRSELIRDVQRCWASMFSIRALSYRLQHGEAKNFIAMAVVVQEMIASECSGTAFSIHPVICEYGQMVVEACFGLGETLVSGIETPDTYIVSKESLTVLKRTVNRQTRGMRMALEGGTEWYEIAEDDANTQVLSDEHIARLSSAVIEIERYHGFPVDVEWAFCRSVLYILQSRPITTLGRNQT